MVGMVFELDGFVQGFAAGVLLALTGFLIWRSRREW
jgi:hypothetical protein